MPNILVADTFRLTRRIGEGTFGKIYEGSHLHTNAQVAVKICVSTSNSLRHEKEIYSCLTDITGIPKYYHYGTEGKYDYMALSLCGPSLENLRVQYTFSLKTILMIGIQVLKRLEDIHARGIIHGDIKPSNLLVGLHEDMHKIFLIDFGLSQNVHKNSSGGSAIIGTLRYMSIRAHKSMPATPWDDLESFAYVVIYLYLGQLPWQDVQHGEVAVKQNLVCTIKETFNFWTLSVPGEFLLILNYIKEGGTNGPPSYVYIKTLLLNLYKLRGYAVDHVMEWTSTYQSKTLKEIGDI
jgi:casein kinase I family protein HRR25